MSLFRVLTVAASLTIAMACGGANDAANGAREGGGGADGFGDNHQPTPAERTGSSAVKALSAEEQQFVQKATMSGNMEVALGRLAEEKGSDDRVKQLGEKIADDHDAANRDLQSSMHGSDAIRAGDPTGVGAQAGSGSQTPTDGMMAEQQRTREQLEQLTGLQFDRAYLDAMVKHHQHDIAEFERAAKSPHQQIRTFAERTLPILRQHLQAAQQLQQGSR